MGDKDGAADGVDRGGRLIAAVAILIVALATRFVSFGNPAVIQDDQFYLLAGEAMRHGALPYVEIWDRKPIGLFLLFSAISSIGGASILVMQLAAIAFAAATAWLIRHIALRVANPRGALFAALAYLLMLPSLGGQSGQSPVFYNLLIVGAFALLVGAVDRPVASIRRHALWAMLLCGVTLTIKPVSVVEGMFFGSAILWMLQRQGASATAIIATAAAMAGVALLPSLAALAAYGAIGSEALAAYVHANFVSILMKQSLGQTARLAGLAYLALTIVPLAAFAALGAVQRGLRDTLARLLLGWIVAAVGGYLLIPNFFDHYALPLLPPLCVSAASLFARRDGPLFFGALLLFAMLHGSITDLAGNRRAKSEVAAVGAVIERARHGGCLFVAEGPAWLYAQSPACRVTPYLFPGHLTLRVEAEALAVPQADELARVLAQRPAVIVARDNERDQRSPAIDRMLSETLAREYRSVARLPEDSGRDLSTLRVWQRRDLPPPSR